MKYCKDCVYFRPGVALDGGEKKDYCIAGPAVVVGDDPVWGPKYADPTTAQHERSTAGLCGPDGILWQSRYGLPDDPKDTRPWWQRFLSD